MGIGDWFKRSRDEPPASSFAQHVPTVTHQSFTIDASSSGDLHEAMMEAMRRNGIDPDNPGEARPDDPEALQRDVMQVLADHGIDLTSAGGAFQTLIGGEGGGFGGEATFHGDPADRLKELAELKAKGLITDEEHAAKRREILGDL